ncbi:TPA: ISL3 family transposase, partial [Elizabethkingia anophelis]
MNSILSFSHLFTILSIQTISDKVHINLQSTQPECFCPNCNIPSSKVHSYYTRKFKDLSIVGKETVIFLKTRKLYCLFQECPIKVFTERFKEHFLSYKRHTARFEAVCLKMVLRSGARPSEKTLRMMGISISDSSLLRLLSKIKFPSIATPIILGIDDWAYKKRHRYGTILVNLETGTVVDILKDRESSTIENWLKSNPGTKIISRDRYGKYINGASKGAPQAIQVADRWHLLKNLGDTVNKLMTREYGKLSKIAKQYNYKSISITPALGENKVQSKTLQRFIEMKELQSKGLPILAITKKLGMHRQTIKKYMSLEFLPRKNYAQGIEQYFSYIKMRMEQEPEIYLKKLWKELSTKGYSKSYSAFSASLIYY